MKAWEAWSVHLGTILVAATGTVYAAMRYLMAPADPYAVVNHPLQSAVQHLHVLAAPLLVFGVGLVWREHVWKHFRQGVRNGRRSGLWMLPTLAPMVVSGYLIQTTVSEAWRTAWVVVHLAASALWLTGYAGHTVAAVRRRLARRETGRPGERGCIEGEEDSSPAEILRVRSG